MRLRLLFWALLAFCMEMVWASAAYAEAGPSAPPTTQEAPSGDAMATSNAWIAALALLAAAGLCAGILVLVNRAHLAQRDLALRSLARGGSVLVATAPAAGGPERRSATFAVSGPATLDLNQVGEFTVPDTGETTTWTIQGIEVYGTAEKDDGRILLFTPHEVRTGVTVTVSAGASTSSKSVNVLPGVAAGENGSTPLTVRFVLRNWGLVLVSVLIVLGAVTLAVAGKLDGGNFVALVAPLAALLGVTATAAGSESASKSGPDEGTKDGETT